MPCLRTISRYVKENFRFVVNLEVKFRSFPFSFVGLLYQLPGSNLQTKYYCIKIPFCVTLYDDSPLPEKWSSNCRNSVNLLVCCYNEQWPPFSAVGNPCRSTGLSQYTAVTATRMSPNKELNLQNNGCARAL